MLVALSQVCIGKEERGWIHVLCVCGGGGGGGGSQTPF